MGELLDFAASAAEKLGTPPEVLTALPVIELTGDRAFMLEQHRGILSYTDRAVRIAVNIGCVCVTGSGLSVRVMNGRKIILCGRVDAVTFERQPYDRT